MNADEREYMVLVLSNGEDQRKLNKRGDIWLNLEEQVRIHPTEKDILGTRIAEQLEYGQQE